MRITVLAYLESETDRRPDVVVDQVVRALESNGHEVSTLCEHGNVNRLVNGLRRRAPELVFNLMEMFGNDWCGDMSVVGLLDLLGVRYTGGGPGEFYLASDKVLCKKVLAYEGVSHPKYAFFDRRDAVAPTRLKALTEGLRFPLFVKPVRGDASIGIDAAGVVHDHKALRQRIEFVHRDCDDSALVEEFIDGREFFVGVVGNEKPLALAPIEVDYSKLPAEMPRILCRKAKFEIGTPQYEGTQSVVAKGIDRELTSRLQKVAVAAYKALRVRDYGRVDLRVNAAGEVFVLEVNPSCYLEKNSELAMAAAASNVNYEELIERIVQAACSRRPAPTQVSAALAVLREEEGSIPSSGVELPEPAPEPESESGPRSRKSRTRRQADGNAG